MLTCVLAACSSPTSDAVGADDRSGPRTDVVGVAASSAFPTESLSDIVSFTDQVSVFTVVSERDGDPEGTPVDRYVPRFVTIQIVENLWVLPQGRIRKSGAKVGAQVELLTWGRFEDERHGTRMVVPYGEERLEVGSSYVGALVWFHDEPPAVTNASLVGSGGSLSRRGLGELMPSGARLDGRELAAQLRLAKRVDRLDAALSGVNLGDLDPIQRLDALNAATLSGIDSLDEQSSVPVSVPE
jgi:hypothetical protein